MDNLFRMRIFFNGYDRDHAYTNRYRLYSCCQSSYSGSSILVVHCNCAQFYDDIFEVYYFEYM